MARFVVPQFIKYKARVVGPLTLQQFMFIGIAGAMSFAFYYLFPFYIFFMTSAIAMFIGASLAFGNIGGRSIPVMLKNLMFFAFGPKIYLWQKKTSLPPKLKERVVIKKERAKIPEIIKEEKESPAPKKSNLRNLSAKIETGIN